jgi:hypothetical protein
VDLSTADQIASVVGGTVGLIALILTIVWRRSDKPTIELPSEPQGRVAIDRAEQVEESPKSTKSWSASDYLDALNSLYNEGDAVSDRSGPNSPPIEQPHVAGQNVSWLVDLRSSLGAARSFKLGADGRDEYEYVMQELSQYNLPEREMFFRLLSRFPADREDQRNLNFKCARLYLEAQAARRKSASKN